MSKSPQPTPIPATPAMTDPLLLFRWLDVVLVVLAAPFVVLAGLPVLGYVVGAAAWIINRVLGAAVERYARTRGNVRQAVGHEPRGIIARSWLVGLTILAVGLAGGREDGLMAAFLVLAAFTSTSSRLCCLRPIERNTPRP